CALLSSSCWHQLGQLLMLPFALKVVWFCLSLTVLCMFSRAIGSYWGPMLYIVFATSLQGIFCLGMIYNMNPPQTLVIYYSAWSLTGVCATFTFATSSSVLWPSPTTSALAWKNKYYLPILVFPLVCLSISLPVLISMDAIQPTDDLHCDATQPEWSRFLGYAGFSMILTIPCLFLSAAAARRVLQLHRTIQRSNNSFMKNTGRHRSRSQLSNEQNTSSERVQSAVILASDTTLAPVGPEMLYSLQPAGGRAGVRSTALYHDTDRSPCAIFGALSASHERFETWDTLGSIEEDGELDPRRQMGGMMLSCKRYLPSRVPNLAPAIWRLILFQLWVSEYSYAFGMLISEFVVFDCRAFFIIQCLAGLSTVIDVARHQPTPTPFGSQHVALILVGWGPAVVFGHLPAVRRQLMFWRRY
ncbi:hypothetical protein HD554DRAFT_2132394, partial [Boletus coccyginus]